MSFDDYDPHEDEKAELRAQDRADRARARAFAAHPDPRDPDYPGEDDE